MVFQQANGSDKSHIRTEPLVIPAGKNVKKISCYSRLSVETFSHTWKMIDFNQIPFIAKYPLSSNPFTLGKRSESSYKVVMTKHFYWSHKSSDGDNDEGDSGSEAEDSDEECESVKSERKEETEKSEELPEADAGVEPKEKPEKSKRIGLRLVKVDDTNTWDVVSYTFTLKTPDGFTITTKLREEPGDPDYEGKPMYAYLTEKDFCDRDLFNEKNLDVVCDITYKYIEGNPYEAPEVCEGKQFASDLKLLYNSKKFSDVLLVVRGAEISAHKSILYARARDFESLMEEDKDTPKQKLDLKLDAEVGKAMIRFIYCGKIDGFPLEKCPDLHDAADTYGVTSLKKCCSSYFRANLDAGVCRDCLGMLDQLDDCLEVVKKLGAAKIKRILSKQNCLHKSSHVKIE